MIRITDNISLDPREIDETFIRASGPGGQNVNKLESAVQLRFDLGPLAQSLSLPVKSRLAKLAGRRLTQSGTLIITAERFRTQERNRQDALARLIDLIRAAAIPPKPRRATRPTLASKRRRLDEKSKRGTLKALRKSRPTVEG